MNLGDLEARLREIVREEIRACGGASSDYSSDVLPPMTSRRSFHEACRSGAIPGARKEGRTWSCRRDDWHAARSRCRPDLRLVPPAKTDAELAREMLAGAGFRLTKKGGRECGSTR